MTAALFATSALRLSPADLYEFQDARSGATQARLVEVARVRSPRGSSTFQGGGRILATTEQGLRLSAGARLLDANLRPLADLVYELPSDPAHDRTTMPDGRDGRGIRWTAPNGAQLAVRRNGDLYIVAALVMYAIRLFT